jgi:hypothetical protein
MTREKPAFRTGDNLPASLSSKVARAKARWFTRIKCHPNLNFSAKCVAHSITDFLNCVTLDCWPSYETLAKSVGGCSTKTIQRAMIDLEEGQFITVRRSRRSSVSNRYAPIFLPVDWDAGVALGGQLCPLTEDVDVPQSSLSTLSISSSTEAARQAAAAPPGYDRRKRGVLELKLMSLLGNNGLDVLSELNAIDEGIVDRLCQALTDGTLSDRELSAARLAAKQFK